MEDLPCGYTKLLDPFRRLLLVRAWCPDRMLHMAEVYVRHSLGSEFIDAPLLDLEVLLLVNFALCFFFCFLLFLAHQPLIASMEQIIVPSIGTFSLKCSFFSAVGAGRVATAAAAHLHPHHLLGSVAEDRNAGQTKRNGTAVALHGSGTPPLPLVPSSFWNKLELAFFTFSLCPLCWHWIKVEN